MSTEGQHCVTGGPGWEDTCCLDSGGAHTLLPHQTLVSPSGQWARRGSVLIQRAVSRWWRSTWRSRLGALQRPAGHPRSPVRSPLGSGYCTCGLLVPLICWDGKSLGVRVPSVFLEPRLLAFYLSLIWGSTKTVCLYSTGIIQHGSAFTPWAPKMEKPSRHSIEPCLGTLQ